MNVTLVEDDRNYNFPAALTNVQGIGAAIPVLEGTLLRPEMKNLLRLATSDEVIPNCDALLYHDGNFPNWQKISADPKRGGEENPITRAANANALIVQPPQDFGFFSIGAGDMFSVKEAEVIREHVKQGHSFSFFAYSEINAISLDQAMKDGKKLAKDLGLENVKHIPLLGDVYTAAVAKEFKEKVGDAELLAASFGFTLQNPDERLSGYTDAAESLTVKLKFIKRHYLSKGSRLFATFDHDTDRDNVLDKYTGRVHDDFTMSGVEHHLGKEIAEHGEIKRRFSGSTAILNRDVIFSKSVAVNLGEGEVLFFRKGTTFWNGVSAKSPIHYVTGAFDAARLDRVMQPVKHNSFACHVVCAPK